MGNWGIGDWAWEEGEGDKEIGRRRRFIYSRYLLLATHNSQFLTINN